MLLEKLVLCDVGTFRGEQSLDLQPTTRAGKNRPVVLFGGLNGAGKTTLLNSIRHVLYGRQALDGTVTQKGYNEYSKGLIHNPVAQLVRPDRAHIELHFTYARLGKKMRYRVCRSWVDRGASVDETLTVTQNDDVKPLLEGDGAQAFLSQLIPAGVSQFFFFDGEKIAALAKDESDDVLADAIRRLLGLDMADRLRSDLAVFLRARRVQGLAADDRKELDRTYSEIESAKASIGKNEAELQEVLVPALTAAQQEVDRRKAVLTDQGGAWAVNRKSLEHRLDELTEQKAALEEQLREDSAGISVFALAPKLSASLLDQAGAERNYGEQKLALEAVRRESTQLKALLAKSLVENDLQSAAAACVDEWLLGIDRRAEMKADVVHGFAGSDVDRLDSSLRILLPISVGRVKTNSEQLSAINSALTRIQDELAHAPSDESIEEAFVAFQTAMKQVAELSMTNRTPCREHWLRVSALIMLIVGPRSLRKLRRARALTPRRTTGRTCSRHDLRLESGRGRGEVQDLVERHFVTAFRRLARKETSWTSGSHPSGHFQRHFFDRHGRSTPKKRRRLARSRSSQQQCWRRWRRHLDAIRRSS